MGLYRNVRSLATCPLFFQKPIPLRMICCRLVWSKSGSTESIYRNLGWERRCLSSKVFNFWVWVFKNALKSANAYLHCCCGCAECMHVSNFASAPFVSIPPPPWHFSRLSWYQTSPKTTWRFWPRISDSPGPEVSQKLLKTYNDQTMFLHNKCQTCPCSQFLSLDQRSTGINFLYPKQL